MSYLNEKTLDIVLEEYADFGYQLTFQEVTQQCSEHPVTGEPTNCKDVASILPVDSLTFSAEISDNLTDDRNLLDSFTISMAFAPDGIIEMTLTKEQIVALAVNRPNNQKAGERMRLIGYYDLVSLDPSADVTTRLMQGKVYISDGVTT